MGYVLILIWLGLEVAQRRSLEAGEGEIWRSGVRR